MPPIETSHRFLRSAAFVLGLLLALGAGLVMGRGMRNGPDQAHADQVPTSATAHAAHAAPADSKAVVLTPHAVGMAQVTTVAVQRQRVTRTLRTVGVVDYNEAGLAAIPTRVSGYLERLFVNQTGTPVKIGDHLAEIYSPDLVVAQQELLVARGRTEGRVLAEASRVRLRRFGISEEQVAEIERSEKIQERLVLTSPIDGVVVEKMVVAQAPVEMGMVLYRIANLDSVWVQLAVHEQDLGAVRVGQTVEIRIDDQPSNALAGRLAFIDPVVDPTTRTARARVVVPNPDRRLKPNLYVTAQVAIPIRADGSPGETGVEGKWTCPMHPDVLVDAAGSCPRCGMPLERIPVVEAASAQGDPLVVPRSALLELGTRTIVWVEDAPGTYRPVPVHTAGNAGEQAIIVHGLSEGDRVVVRGGFLIDSEAQILGLPSLMRPEGGVGATGHQQHGGGPVPAGAASQPAGAPAHPH